MPSSQEIAAPQAVAMPFADYQSVPGLSNSGMRDLSISPLRYWFRHINPDRLPEEPTPEQAFGSALHCAVLEPASFDERYICEIDETDFAGCLRTVGEMREWAAERSVKLKGTLKADLIAQVRTIDPSVPILDVELERFAEQSAGKAALNKSDWSRVAGAARALAEEPEIIRMLSEGQPEVSLFATDPETGVPLKARLDWMAPQVTWDLKTFVAKRGASIDKAVADAIWYEGYWRQAYFYHMMRVRAAAEPKVFPKFVIAFVESDQPHEVRIRELGPKFQGLANTYWMRARAEVRGMINLYAECWKRWGNKPWTDKQNIEMLTDQDMPQVAY